MKTWLLSFILALLLFNITTVGIAKERIVTIGGDVSEISYALGVGEKIVGRDSTSLQPSAIRALPDIGYMRQINAEGILAMKPTLVLSSALAEPSLVLQQIADSGVEVVSIPGDATLDTVPKKIAAIAAAIDQFDKGLQLTQTYRQKIAAIDNHPLAVHVLCIMSHGGNSPLAAGQHTAADAMIRAAGAKNAMQGFNRYQPLSQEGAIASAPDLLLVTTDGVKSLGGVDKIWQLPGIALTPAGKHRRILVLDDMALLGFGLQTPDVLGQLRHAAEQSL
ncbi:heme/hemin ABC transporter substrate-binding protein [Candidatus Fukatsuia endosymbiont of Tuberolachnus salignus]|uniref:heme/hemin ABC transporter substrate-binding protein n=1 Tax=Candidatus Fukatsuia endosymbiont of Tuberolachnus salignus TaxID=3077957 RepID=UPI00313E3FE9